MGNNFNLKIEPLGQVVVMKLAGVVDNYVISEMRDAFTRIQEEYSNRIVVDLHQVTHISSSAVGILIGRMKKLEDSNGGIKIAHMSSAAEKIMRIMGAVKVFEIFDQVEDAVASFK